MAERMDWAKTYLSARDNCFAFQPSKSFFNYFPEVVKEPCVNSAYKRGCAQVIVKACGVGDFS